MLKVGAKLWRTYSWTPYPIVDETAGWWLVQDGDQTRRVSKRLAHGWMERREWRIWAAGPGKRSRKVAELLGLPKC
jgi:hypothetical protein